MNSTQEKTDASSGSNDPEEVVVPGVAALVAILLTGLLYLVLPPNVIIGPNWLLLVVEGVFVVPLVIDRDGMGPLTYGQASARAGSPRREHSGTRWPVLRSSFSRCQPIDTDQSVSGCGPAVVLHYRCHHRIG